MVRCGSDCLVRIDGCRSGLTGGKLHQGKIPPPDIVSLVSIFDTYIVLTGTETGMWMGQSMNAHLLGAR